VRVLLSFHDAFFAAFRLSVVGPDGDAHTPATAQLGRAYSGRFGVPRTGDIERHNRAMQLPDECMAAATLAIAEAGDLALSFMATG